jgi:hypothetical protein
MSQVREFFKVRLGEVGNGALKEHKYYGIDYEDIVLAYEELGMECPIMIREGNHGHYPRGWGNGYVLVPEGHKFHGKHYYDIDVNVHGGLTFGEVIDEGDDFGWRPGHWIGFDTAHDGDNKTFWTKLEVLKETISLFLQL